MSSEVLLREAAEAFDQAALQLHRAAQKMDKLNNPTMAQQVREMVMTSRSMRMACQGSMPRHGTMSTPHPTNKNAS